jgi:recombination protein U
MPIKNTSNKIGSTFESKLIKIFNQYREQNKAYIIKIPNEVTIIRNGAKIINAIHRQKSDCLDFLGLLPNGKGIIFEAKTTKNKTNFPLSNIQDYQYDLADELLHYVNSVFYIIEFRELNEIYLVHTNKIKNFILTNNRKSIPISWFKNNENATLLTDLDILKYLNI